MLEKMLELAGSAWLAPIAITAALAWLLNQLKTMHQIKGARRREFLELWSANSSPDDVWLEVAVRHTFGEYLPASIIRMLMRSRNGARALLEVSEAWTLLEYREETDEVVWRGGTLATARGRQLRQFWMLFCYFVLMFAAIFVACLLLKVRPEGALQMLWVPALALAGFAATLLWERERLKEAHVSVPRWLGLN